MYLGSIQGKNIEDLELQRKIASTQKAPWKWGFTVAMLLIVLGFLFAVVSIFTGLSIQAQPEYGGISMKDIIDEFTEGFLLPVFMLPPLVAVLLGGSKLGLQASVVTGVIAVTIFYFTVFTDSGAGFGALYIIPIALYYAGLSMIFGIYYLIVHKGVTKRIILLAILAVIIVTLSL